MTASGGIDRTDTVRAAAQAALHPWNHGFEQPVIRSDRRLVTDDQARQFDEHGYLRLDDVLDLKDLAAIRAAIDPHERKVNDFLATLEGADSRLR